MGNYGFVFGWILSIHNWIFAIPNDDDDKYCYYYYKNTNNNKDIMIF